jgi:hypothetical protein
MRQAIEAFFYLCGAVAAGAGAAIILNVALRVWV